MDRAYELVVEGVTEDYTVFRDTIYLVGEDGIDVAAAARQVAEACELSLTTLWEADEQAWRAAGLVPADRDRERFLAAAGQVLPNATTAFAGTETVIIDG